MDWVTLSLISGLISGICWLLGDILLVGFDLEEEKYKEFIQGAQIKNKRLVILMLSGSVKRLRFGALIANFSIPLMLFSVYSLFSLAEHTFWTTIAVVLLSIGFSLSPVAHVAYYYVGTVCKNIFVNTPKGEVIRHSDQVLIKEYISFLDITWWVAVGITALGWAVYTVLILMGKTAFPPLFFLLTPLIISPVATALSARFKVGRPYLNGAAFNIGLTIFFIAVLLYNLFS